MAGAMAALLLAAVVTVLAWQLGLLDARLPAALQHAPAARQTS
jgi:hypothetical protein